MEEPKKRRNKGAEEQAEKMRLLEERLLGLESDKKENEELKARLLELEVGKLEKEKAEEEQPVFEEKEVAYQTIVFRRFDKPGICLDFLYNLKQYQLPDQCEVELKKEVVDHLNALVERESTSINLEKGEKIYTYKPRFHCAVKSERTKIEKVKVK